MFNTLGGNRSGGGMSPIMLGLMGLLAYRTLKGKGKLADMLGTNQAGSSAGDAPAGGGPGGLLGGGSLGCVEERSILPSDCATAAASERPVATRFCASPLSAAKARSSTPARVSFIALSIDRNASLCP